jgi:magnesium-transporting ATPase (P-type)
LEDPFNVILIIAAVVSLILGVYQQGWKYGWIDGLSICIALTIITTVNTANEKSKQDSFRKLMEAGEKTISKVIRNEATIEIDSTELVVGDIVVVENGKKIPADIVLIQCEEVKCD